MANHLRPTLASVGTGSAATVTAVDDAHAAHLAREGIAPGVLVRVEATAPFGGPLIVRVGRARVALGRRVAATVEIDAATAIAP